MSMLSRLAKGFGAAALTNNLGAGLVAAGTNSFSLGAATGLASNLLNPYGMMGGMNMYGMGGMGMGMGGVNAMTMGNLGMAGMGMYNGFNTISPFNMGGMGMGFNSYPMTMGMWSNPMMMW